MLKLAPDIVNLKRSGVSLSISPRILDQDILYFSFDSKNQKGRLVRQRYSVKLSDGVESWAQEEDRHTPTFPVFSFNREQRELDGYKRWALDFMRRDLFFGIKPEDHYFGQYQWEDIERNWCHYPLDDLRYKGLMRYVSAYERDKETGRVDESWARYRILEIWPKVKDEVDAEERLARETWKAEHAVDVELDAYSTQVLVNGVFNSNGDKDRIVKSLRQLGVKVKDSELNVDKMHITNYVRGLENLSDLIAAGMSTDR